MTYCVGLFLREGLVMLADTRTNAGVDHISTFSKMFTATKPGERMLCLLSAGNLAITQSAWNRLEQGVFLEGQKHTLFTVSTMFQAAQLVGEAIRDVYRADASMLSSQNIGFDVSIMLGGQIAGGPQRLYLIYAAGNFIEATPDNPFLQIGEHKYGKPVLDRGVKFDTPIEQGIKLVLVSMDSTIRSNLTCGLPLDMLVTREGTQAIAFQRRIVETDPYLTTVRVSWEDSLRAAWLAIPPPDWETPA
jgi:putative proteasome-type protease